MITTLLIAALFGGASLFLWSAVSWMTLSWHRKTLNAFKNEQAVRQALADNVKGSGLYTFAVPKDLPPEELKAAQEKMMKGPQIFLVYRSNTSSTSMGVFMARSYAINVLAAFLVAWMMYQIPHATVVQRVSFAMIFGAASGVVTHLPYWSWWGFPSNHTVVSILDLIIGWFLAGMVIAKVLA